MSSLKAFSEHLGTIPTKVLSAIVTDSDPSAIRRAIVVHLANRGVDPRTGSWVGFPSAAESALALLVPEETLALRSAVSNLSDGLAAARPFLPEPTGTAADQLIALSTQVLLTSQPSPPPLVLLQEASAPCAAFNQTTARLAARLARQHLAGLPPTPTHTAAALRAACNALDLPDPSSAGEPGRRWLNDVHEALARSRPASDAPVATIDPPFPVPGA